MCMYIYIYMCTHMYTHTQTETERWLHFSGGPWLIQLLVIVFFFHCLYFFFQFSSSTKLWVPQSQSQSFIFFQCLSQHLAWCWTYSRKLKGISWLLVIILFSLHCQLIFACPIFQMNIFFISLRISLWMIQAKVYKVLG